VDSVSFAHQALVISHFADPLWHAVTADKGSIGAQATFGIQKDTHLAGQQFACEPLSEHDWQPPQ
jgi:hypothetical protein